MLVWNVMQETRNSAARSRMRAGAALMLLLTLAPAAAAPQGINFEITPAGASAPVSLYAEEAGAGTPVLLIHGLGCSSFTWRKLIPALARNHRVIALDLKGFGRSAKPEDSAYAAEDQAALVAAFIKKKGLEGVTLVGHSFGGTVALRTAIRPDMQRQGLLSRIVVIGAPALPGSVPRRMDVVRLPAVPDAIAERLSPEVMARFLLNTAMRDDDAFTDDVVEGYAAPYREKGAVGAFLATARSIVSEANEREIAARYRALPQPALVIWCRKDPIVPLQSGKRLSKAIPRSRLALIEGCHHLPQEEKPADLIRLIERFLVG
jgi:pimeloyl-ACP methyl ester carboxylesterase